MRLATSGGVYTKVALTLAAYRGLDTDQPLVSISGWAGAGEPAAHTTPVASNSTSGAWRVSYWSDKNSATTRWSEPNDETVRATTTGSGGGRIGTLLTDPGASLIAGTPATTGNLTATANAGASRRPCGPLLLRPADDVAAGQPAAGRAVHLEL